MHRRAGFTLLEVLLVISLLGAVTLGSSFGLKKQFLKIRDAQRKLDLKMIQTALNEYYDSSLCYPAYLPQCGQPLMLGATMFLYQTPCDPLTRTAYPYDTATQECNDSFRLYTTLENTEDDDIRYVGCEEGCGPDMCIYNYGLSSSNSDLRRCKTESPPVITPTVAVTATPAPTATPIYIPSPIPTENIGEFVCAPGLGNDGHCEEFEFPELSDCPRIYLNDPTCNYECGIRENHCKNSRGKSK